MPDVTNATAMPEATVSDAARVALRFSQSDLAFARRWAEATPDHWEVQDVQRMDDGDETLPVIPPCCDFANLLVVPCDDGSGYVTLRQLHTDLGGEMVLKDCQPTLREALLALHPLDAGTLAEIDAATA